MIVKGAARRSSKFWSRHLTDTKENSRAEIIDIRGLAAENLRDAFLEMEIDARQTRCINYFYQCIFAPPHGISLTDEQYEKAFAIFEKHRGIPEGQPRIVIEHEKNGEVHRHVIWSRIDTEKMRAWPDGLDAKIAHAASRQIREELGLERVISPFDKDREGPRPERAPDSYEMFRGLNSGIDPREIKAGVTKIFRESRNAADFVAGLEQHGYQLAQGDRRDYVILDSAGEVHSLARRLDGVKAKELREFMKDLPREMFPTVDQARSNFREQNMADRLADLATVQREIAWEEELRRDAIKKERKEERFKEPTAKEIREREAMEKRWPIDPPKQERTRTSPEHHFADAAREATRDRTHEPPKELRGMSAILMKTYRNSREGYDGTDLDAHNKLSTFQESLDRMGVGFARVTKEEAERSKREAEFAKAVGNYMPRLQEDEIVAVRAWHTVYRNDGEIVPPGQRVYRLDQGTARKFVETLGVEQTLIGVEPTKQIMQVKVQERAQQNAEKWRETRSENATTGTGAAREMGNSGAGAAAKITGRLAGKTFDTVADMFESLFAPKSTPEQIVQAAELKQEQQAAQRQREQQEQQMRRQIERDR